jgi:hypothetical protein
MRESARFILAAGMLAGLLAALPGAATSAGAQDAAVAFYHAGPDRSGHYVVPGLTWSRAGSVQIDTEFDGRVEGPVYAQPLFWRPQGEVHGRLIVATSRNIVIALDAATGRALWQRSLGPPVSAATLPCGNIDPVGITGTPVIDARDGRVYVDAVVDVHGNPAHLLFGLALQDGAMLPGWPLDLAAALRARGLTFDPAVQEQRGALTLLDGRLYVPFGGYFGDCGAYHGWIVGITLPLPAVFGTWATSARKGGIWAPGGIASDGRSLFAATGNTAGAAQWGGGEAVLRLRPDLRWRDDADGFFTPEDWHALDAHDLDLGGTAPLPLDLPAGPEPRALLLALGKNGDAYLIDRAHPGGIGHPLGVAHVADSIVITAPAAWRDGADMMVALQARDAACPSVTSISGLLALRISPGTPPGMRPAWCAPFEGRGAPIVTTTPGGANPIVWVVGAEGDGRLHGFRGDTGAPVFGGGGAADRMAGLRHFATPLAADGRLYVAGDGRVFAFGFAAASP